MIKEGCLLKQGRDAVSAEDIQKAVQLVIIPRATTLNNPPEDDDQQPPPPPPPPPPQDQQQVPEKLST